MIARLVGARRPSVTTSVLALERAAAIERREDGAFALHAEPQPELLGAATPEGPWESRATQTLVLDELRAQWARNAEARAAAAARRAELARARAVAAGRSGGPERFHLEAAEAHERARGVHAQSAERQRRGPSEPRASSN
jgi:hypothetical protein